MIFTSKIGVELITDILFLPITKQYKVAVHAFSRVVILRRTDVVTTKSRGTMHQ
jgi:hypothetical protein